MNKWLRLQYFEDLKEFVCAGQNTLCLNENSKQSEAIGAFVMTRDKIARQREVWACLGPSWKDTRYTGRQWRLKISLE